MDIEQTRMPSEGFGDAGDLVVNAVKIFFYDLGIRFKSVFEGSWKSRVESWLKCRLKGRGNERAKAASKAGANERAKAASKAGPNFSPNFSSNTLPASSRTTCRKSSNIKWMVAIASSLCVMSISFLPARLYRTKCEYTLCWKLANSDSFLA